MRSLRQKTVARGGRAALAVAVGVALIALGVAVVVMRARPLGPGGGTPETPGGGISGAGNATVEPAAIAAALDAAQRYINSAETAKAEAILGPLLERVPDHGGAHEMLGRALLVKARDLSERGDVAGVEAIHHEAYRHYRAAVASDSDSAGLQHSAGVVAAMARQTDAALEHFEAAARLDARNPQYPLYAAQMLVALDRRAEARARLDVAIALDPDEPLAHATLARIAIVDGHFTDALAHVRAARDLDRRDVRFRVIEAEAIRRGGDPLSALELVAALSQSDRAEAGVAAELAACRTALGDHAGAARAWEDRFNLGTRDGTAWETAASASDAWIRAGETEAARQWLVRARVLAPRGAPPSEERLTALEARLEALPGG